MALTPLTHEARALYEAGVVPVRELARLCGVSVPGLYYHIRRHGWRRRRPAVPRDANKAARQRQRYLAQKALRPPPRRGLKACDPQGEAMAAELCQRASALSQAALVRALARRDAEADARVLSILARALRDIAALAQPQQGRGEKPRNTSASGMGKARPMIESRSEQSARNGTLARVPTANVPRIPLVTLVASRPVTPPPVAEEAPLSDTDRRINAIAAEFYARRGGNR